MNLPGATMVAPGKRENAEEEKGLIKDTKKNE